MYLALQLLQLKVLLLLWYILHISAEEGKKNSNDLARISQKDGNDNSTNLVSKISSWLFPSAQSRSDQNDLDVAETGYAPQKYHATSLSNVDCNICNQSPWIPIIGNNKQNANYHYEPPKAYSGHSIEHSSFDDHLKSNVNGPSNYFGPSISNLNYGLHNKYNSFNQQNSIAAGEIQIAEYMVPPPVHYKIPNKVYGSPQKQLFGPPNNKHFYNSPPIPSYSPPKPFYGAPPKPGFHIPGHVYGRPKPVSGPPNPLYGPPKYLNISPVPLYGPPKSNFVLHQQPAFRPPPIQYGTPQPTYEIPPKPFYSSPKPYNIHPSQSLSSDINSLAGYTHNHLPEYTPPFKETKYSSGEPPVEFYRTPSNAPTQSYGEPANPGHFNSDSHLEFDLPSNNYHSFTNNQNIPSTVTDISNSVKIPSDSYGAPVTNENIELADTIPDSSEESAEQYKQQIPLPNLSSLHVLPIRNHRNFNKDHSSKRLNFEKPHISNDVQIQPSVEVANYIASIEHPINVIQSPIYDVSVKEQFAKGQSTSQKFLNGDYNQIISDQNKHVQKSHERLPSSYESFDPPKESHSRNIQDEIAKEEGYSQNDYQSSISFKDNPIIVEDNNPAASDITNTSTIPESYQIKKDNNKQSALTPSVAYNLSDETINDPLFKQLLIEIDKSIENNLKENSEFTASPMDYSAWQPTSGKSTVLTSMVPPPMSSVSTWVTPKKIQKPLQIIIPYTNNKKQIYSGKDWSLKTPKWQPPKDTYTTLGSIYMPPNPTEESIWSKFMDNLRYTELQRLPAKAFTSSSYNQNYGDGKLNNEAVSTPRYNEVILQKSIDNWTQQSYAMQDNRNYSPVSKIIPNIFLPTKPYTATTESPIGNKVNNFVAAASIRTDSVVDTKGNYIEQNQVSHTAKKQSNDNYPVTVPSKTVTKLIKQVAEKPLWSTSQVTESPQTKEKVYVVTPQSYAFVTPSTVIAWSMAPKVENGKVNNGTYDSHRFTIKIESENKLSKTAKNDKTGAIKVVYSEWPHLINSLESTTSKPTARHPLFGLMDIAEDFTPVPNTTASMPEDRRVTTERTTKSTTNSSTETNVTNSIAPES